MSDLSRNSLSIIRRTISEKETHSSQTGCSAYRDRGTSWACSKALVSTESLTLYDQLSHPFSGIRQTSCTDSSDMVLCISQMVSWTSASDVGGHSIHGNRIGGTRIPKYWAMVSGRR